MVCEECMEVAEQNRALYDEFDEDRNLDNLDQFLWEHPDCGCACQHMFPAEWQKMFSVERPK